MKLLNHYKLFFVLIIVCCVNSLWAQETKPRLLIDVVYHQRNNNLPYVSVFAKSKIEKKFIPIPNISIKIFLGDETDAGLLGTVMTDKDGLGIVGFPVTVRSLWDTVSQFKLIATSIADKQFASAGGEATVKKARIFIDTLNAGGTRSVLATVKEKRGNEWVAVKDVETKLIIQRSVGNLSVGDKETYSTDSTGQATAEFKNVTIPGDTAGNIILVAKTEENESYGSISIEKKVKWGTSFIPVNTFDRRTLFATRDKAPLWLLFLAGSIFITVWSVIVYLVVQIGKIRKAGISEILSPKI